MKKIFTLITLLTMGVSMNAQYLKLYKGTEVVKSYLPTEVDKIVFEDFVRVANIGLSATTATLYESKTKQLTATVTPSNATLPGITWTSDNTAVATVSDAGLVTALSAGTATITVSSTDGSGTSATCTVTVKAHEYVDLGLSVKWATCNVGAEKLSDYGDYFAWGETTGYNSGKTNFSWSTYKWCKGSQNTMTKYCTKSSRGTVDNKTVLEAGDDAATANWGSYWRMPTKAEWQELIDNCTWTWTQLNGVKGYKVTSKKSGYTDRFIFLPAAGCRYDTILSAAGSTGNYWSNSLNTDSSYSAWIVFFYSGNHSVNGTYRYYSLSTRAVRVK